MSFDPYNHPLKIQKSIGTSTPNVGVHLGMWGFILSHFLTLLETWNVTLGLHSWLAPLQALALVTSPRLKLRHRIFTTSYVATLFRNVCSSFIRGAMYTSKLCIFTNSLPWIIKNNMRNFLVISRCEILQLKIKMGQVYYVFFFSPQGFIPSLTNFNITL
jgi:hypothetical protein